MLQDELYRAQAELVAELEAFGALRVAEVLADAASALGAEDEDEVRTSGVGAVLVYGAGLGVGGVSGGEVVVGVEGVVGVPLVEVSVEDVTGVGATGVDPPSVICVIAKAGLALPESPKTSQRCIFSPQTVIGRMYSRTTI